LRSLSTKKKREQESGASSRNRQERERGSSDSSDAAVNVAHLDDIPTEEDVEYFLSLSSKEKRKERRLLFPFFLRGGKRKRTSDVTLFSLYRDCLRGGKGRNFRSLSLLVTKKGEGAGWRNSLERGGPSSLKNRPRLSDGKVGKKARRLHLLHGTSTGQWG